MYRLRDLRADFQIVLAQDVSRVKVEEVSIVEPNVININFIEPYFWYFSF